MGIQVAMQLADLLGLYIASHDCSARYVESLRRTARQAGACGIKTVGDLDPQHVNKFLANLSTAAVTRQNVRRELLTLWRWAFDEGHTEVPPLRVMRIRAVARPVEAWSMKDMQRMLALAEKDDTKVSVRGSMRVRDYLPGWIVIAYDSGLRFGDMLALRGTNFRNGAVCGTAHKTGKALVRPLSKYSCEWAQRLLDQSPDGSLFSWFLTRRRAIVTMRQFLDRNNMHGSSKFLRRACATYIEAQAPGNAWRYLQHSVPTLVQRHYVDSSLLDCPAGPPPIR